MLYIKTDKNKIDAIAAAQNRINIMTAPYIKARGILHKNF